MSHKDAILSHFRTAYESLMEMNNLLIKEAQELETEEKIADGDKDVRNAAISDVMRLADLLGHVNGLRILLNNFHHRMGHALFEKCWRHTKVGNEDMPEGLEDLLSGVGLDGELKVEQVAYEDLPPEVKNKIDEVIGNVGKAQKRYEN